MCSRTTNKKREEYIFLYREFERELVREREREREKQRKERMKEKEEKTATKCAKMRLKREFFCVNEQRKGLTRAKQNNDSVEHHEMVISILFEQTCT